MVFQESLKGVLSLKGVSRKFQESFKKVLGVFQDRFKGASKKIEGCFIEVLSGFQGCL